MKISSFNLCIPRWSLSVVPSTAVSSFSVKRKICLQITRDRYCQHNRDQPAPWYFLDFIRMLSDFTEIATNEVMKRGRQGMSLGHCCYSSSEKAQICKNCIIIIIIYYFWWASFHANFKKVVVLGELGIEGKSVIYCSFSLPLHMFCTKSSTVPAK